MNYDIIQILHFLVDFLFGCIAIVESGILNSPIVIVQELGLSILSMFALFQRSDGQSSHIYGLLRAFSLVFHNTYLIKKYLGESRKFKTSLTRHRQSCVERAQPSLGKHAADWWEETQACSGKGIGGYKLAVPHGCQLSCSAERVCAVSHLKAGVIQIQLFTIELQKQTQNQEKIAEMLKTKLETSEYTRMRWFKNTAARGLMLPLLCRVQALLPTGKFRLGMTNLVNYKINKCRFFFFNWQSSDFLFYGICYCLTYFLNYAHGCWKKSTMFLLEKMFRACLSSC